MSDQANAYQNQIMGNAQQLSVGIARQQFQTTRLEKVWVAYCSGEYSPAVLAVFPTKALADIFLEGANSAKADEIMVIERTINYGG